MHCHLPQAVKNSRCHCPSICCMQHHTPYKRLIHPTSGHKGYTAVCEKGEQFANPALNTFMACYSSKLATTASSEHVPHMTTLWDNHKFFVVNPHMFYCSSILLLAVHRTHLKSGSGRKGPFGVFDQVRYKPGCTATEDG